MMSFEMQSFNYMIIMLMKSWLFQININNMTKRNKQFANDTVKFCRKKVSLCHLGALLGPCQISMIELFCEST